jgi:hypothetical protein
MYTLKQVREFALSIAGLTNTASIGGYDPNLMVNAMLREAHEAVQREVRKLDPQTFIRHDRFTYEANAVSVDAEAKFDTATYGRIDKIVALGQLAQDADVSVTNMPMFIQPYAGSNRGGVTPIVTIGVDTSYGVPTGMSGRSFYSGGESWLGWRMQNKQLYLSPIPTADVYIHVEWVPVLRFDADTDLCLGGWVPEAEMLVVYDAALRLSLMRGLADGATKARTLYETTLPQVVAAVQKRPASQGFVNLTHPDTPVQRARC